MHAYKYFKLVKTNVLVIGKCANLHFTMQHLTVMECICALKVQEVGTPISCLAQLFNCQPKMIKKQEEGLKELEGWRSSRGQGDSE